jgi:Secretion system C-terminal sorting domain
MKRILLPLLCLSLISSVRLFSQQSSGDFFPLSVGNSWTYNYYAEDNELLGQTDDIDSGKASYTIISNSTAGDSSVWLFREVRDITHWHLTFGIGWASYPINDSTSFQLVEYLDANHKIVSYSTDWKSVFYMKSAFTDSTPFFRYYPLQLADTFTVIYGGFYNSSIKETLTIGYQRSVGLGSASYLQEENAYILKANRTLTSEALTSVKNSNSLNTPDHFQLEQNFPNPFNPNTTIIFQTSNEMTATIRIYDILGKLVGTLFKGDISPGVHSMPWNASGQPSGIYFCIADGNGQSQLIKLILMK